MCLMMDDEDEFVFLVMTIIVDNCFFSSIEIVTEENLCYWVSASVDDGNSTIIDGRRRKSSIAE